MIARIQIRRDKESNWAANNPILTLGEIGYDEDTEKFKVGISNSSRWNDLPYELGQWKTDESGNISYGYASDGPAEGNVSIKNDLFVGGDLTVKGTTTTINTEVATFKDDIIQLNLDVDDTGIYSGTLQSGFEVNRGNVPSIGLSSQKIYWDEADGPSGRWGIDTDLNVLGDIYSNGTALWRLNGNDIYFDNGYVAIGLDNPSSVLHIKDITPIITLEDENNPAHIWQVGQNADQFFINTETVVDGSMFSMLDDGKVGIGTSPIYDLHVRKDQAATTNIALQNFTVDTSANAQIFIETKPSAGDPQIQFQIDGTEAYVIGIDNNDSDKFKISDSSSLGTNDRLVIDSTGNVGIGTSAPTAPLDVDADSNAQNISLRARTGTDFSNIAFKNDAGSSTLVNIGAVGDELRIFTGSDLNNERLRIDGNGNVGIGTTTPQARLSVSRGDDTIELDHITSPDTNRILSYDRSDNVELPLKIRGSILTFDTGATERIKVLNNGNVGIGKTPTERLHVYTETSMDHVMIDGTSGIHRSLGFATSGVRRWQLYADNKSESGTNSGTDLRIARYSDNGTYIGLAMEIQRSTGNIGLGVVPSEKLHINGSSGVFAKITDASTSGTIETGLVLERSGANTDYRVLNNGTFRVQTATDASTWTDIMTITSAGDVDFLGDVTSGGSAVGVWTPSGNDIFYNTGAMSGSIKIGNFDNVDNLGNTEQFGEGTKLEFIADTNPKYSNHDTFTVAYMKAEYDGTGADTRTGDTALTFATYDGYAGSANGSISEKMRISSSGNVGINIISPETKLHIESNTSIGNETLLRIQRPNGHGYSGFNQYYNSESGSGQNYVPALWGLNFGLSVTNDSNGKVGIKFESGAGPSNHASDKIIFRTSGTDQVDIDNSGNLTASGTITSSSDITLKENIELISDPIEKVKELSGYTFNKKGEDLRLVGLIAQEVEKVLPEAVHENQEGLKSLAYGNLVALLVECVKKQDERIESLERTIKEMK